MMRNAWLGSVTVLAALAIACAQPRTRVAPSAPVPPAGSPPASVASVADAGETEERRPNPLRPAYAKALDGDMGEALRLLEPIPEDALDDGERRERSCMLDRFAHGAPVKADADAWLAGVLSIYEDYWTQVLLRRTPKDDARGRLVDRLRKALGLGIAPAGSDTRDQTLDALGAALTKRGFHSIRGVTAPYQDLMIWRQEDRASYEVQIPDGARKVEVVMMHDFVSLGWEGFATCGRHYPGGWAEPGRLYCMADAYDRSSERFSVSYLAHETQHFADYERFPKLAGPELEYRAKLAELIESRLTTRTLVALFATQTSTSRDSSHSYANACLVRDLQRELLGPGPDARASWWDALPEERIRASARALFDANTRMLEAKGPSVVTTFL
jgi:hypothetical protein